MHVRFFWNLTEFSNHLCWNDSEKVRCVRTHTRIFEIVNFLTFVLSETQPCSSWISRNLVQIWKSARLASSSREICAKFSRKNCKFSGISARYEHRIRFSRPAFAAQTVWRHWSFRPGSSCVQIRKSRRAASNPRKFCAKIQRKNCKICDISARLAQKELRVLGRTLRNILLILVTSLGCVSLSTDG